MRAQTDPAGLVTKFYGPAMLMRDLIGAPGLGAEVTTGREAPGAASAPLGR